MPTPRLTAEIISAAIEGFESQKRRIDDQIAELRAMLPGASKSTATPEVPTRKRKKFSATARLRMKQAQQRRWAKIRGESEPPAPAATLESAKPKRRISEEGMKRIIAATKKRWALKRAEAAKAQPAAAKKAATGRKKGARKAAKRAAAKSATAPAPATQAAG